MTLYDLGGLEIYNQFSPFRQHMKELSARKNVHIGAQHVCFKRARFQVSYKFIRVIICNLRGSPYRRNLGVIIFNGRNI